MSRDLLTSALRAVAGAPDAAQLLSGLAGVVVPAAADWCLGDVLAPPDLVTRVVALGLEGPLPVPGGADGRPARRSSAHSAGLLRALADAPGRRLRLTAADLQALTAHPDPRTAAQAGLALRLGTQEVLVLGLVDRDELLGVLTLGRTASGFRDEDVTALADVALLTGAALDGVRLRALQRGVSTALQTSLLPQLPAVPGLTLAARFVPADAGLAVGGDWYDAFVLPAGEVAVVVGDATGHDVQAATRMAELRTLLRGVAVDREQGPAATLSRVDHVAAHLAPELSGTCVYAQLGTTAPGAGRQAGGRLLRWSSAGHLPPVLLRDGRAELLDTTPDLMLGVRTGTTRADHARALREGDLLVLYTDGLVEDRETGLDERLVVLAREVERLGADDPEALVEGLVAALARGEDDVAVLAVRVDGPVGSASGA